MKFSIFKTVKAQRGELLTAELFDTLTHDPQLAAVCARIAQEPDHERQQELKKQLPVVTWNAWFEGQRKNALAQPSGLFMLDIDGVEQPYKLWCSIIARREELGILLAHKTPSGHGLRLVCRCRKEFSTIDECQQWLSAQIGVEHDPACKDWARASYLVPADYVYYLDGKLFIEEAVIIYDVRGKKEDGGAWCAVGSADSVASAPETQDKEHRPSEPARTQAMFKGLSLGEIAKEWLKATGGEPEQGERNTRLHALAFEMRYITDFNEETLLATLPRYGMDEQEMRSLIHSACIAPRSKGLPKQLEQVMQQMRAVEQEGDEEADEELYTLNSTLSTGGLPPLPPLMRQIAQTAPADFKPAVVLCMLPLLGALGSKLRARYLDKHLHSPSFQVSLEAPQASGKSFMTRLAERLLQPIMERDIEERRREQEYNERMAEMKVTGMKVTAKNRESLLGQRPKGIIRYVPATISITKMLMRMENARGLHLVAVCEEIDTVTKAFKRGFSSYSDALRVSFDNALYGQDYASDTSYSGILPLYYNTLFSGTPKAMRRFYPDVEDGLVSRVCFAGLPDQFGKPMPEWGELSEKENEEVQRQMERLDKVCIEGDVVQPEHEMELDFLNRALSQWLHEQQEEAIRTDDRTRDIFCRRAAVVGFRAGMLAWFLYGEKPTRTYRTNTIAFARWVADQMLTQHLLRFQIEGTGSNINRWEEAYKMLGDEFSREELQRVLSATGSTTPTKNVIYHWRLLGSVEPILPEGNEGGTPLRKSQIRFRKRKVG